MSSPIYRSAATAAYTVAEWKRKALRCAGSSNKRPWPLLSATVCTSRLCTDSGHNSSIDAQNVQMLQHACKCCNMQTPRRHCDRCLWCKSASNAGRSHLSRSVQGPAARLSRSEWQHCLSPTRSAALHSFDALTMQSEARRIRYVLRDILNASISWSGALEILS